MRYSEYHPKMRALMADQVNRTQDFSRQDESDDAAFYAPERLVSHLDATALATVRELIGSLVVERQPKVLDLMASWDSHLPPELEPARVVGLGLNRAELEGNPALDEYLIHDLNQDPRLPLPDDSFDVVLNTVSVDYLTDPVAVFSQVARVLKPGGLHLIIFSNRWFEPKVTQVWRDASELERVILVEEWLRAARAFGEPRTFTSQGQPRPAHDKYAHLGIPSDPIYAVFADRKGGDPARAPRPLPRRGRRYSLDQVAQRSRQVASTLECPYCGQRLRKWEVPQGPFTEWDNEFMYICFNDQCPYLLGGWEAMGRQGNLGVSYRLMFNPASGALLPVPVHGLGMLKDGIMD